ncbi:MAG TPA: tetratricopeptide repeat protein, partial [Pseudonocardiaceae bacterium]|nr:tetratricopeptide repeat protein [Pseudonocardiaceae bacterium]
LPEAEPLYRKALALLGQHGLVGQKLSWVHTHFGDWWLDQGRTREALAEYEQALRAAEPTGDQQHIAWILVHMSDADCAAGLPHRALDRLAEAQNVARASDDAGSEAWISVHRSVALRLAGRFGEAERVLRTALGYYESNHDVQGVAWALRHLGDLYRAWQRPVEATDAYRQLRTVALHLGNSRLSKLAISVLAELDES